MPIWRNGQQMSKCFLGLDKRTELIVGLSQKPVRVGFSWLAGSPLEGAEFGRDRVTFGKQLLKFSL